MADQTNAEWRERMDRVERGLERLTERHEALAQSIELMHHDWEQRWSGTRALVERVAGAVETLAGIVGSHERRLENLEGGRA